MTEHQRRRCASILLIAGMLVTSTASAALAEATVTETTACRAEVEPNGSLDEAMTLEAERCVSGTLVEIDDEDLFVWQVDSEAAASTWEFSLTGAPGLAPTASVVAIETDVETGTPGLGAEVGRIEIAADGDNGAATLELALDVGDYALVIHQADVATARSLDEDAAYELRWTPSGSAATVASRDQARIIVGAAETTTPVVGPGAAVELLLDTSGSMLHPLDQTTKLEAAEQSLISIVHELPVGLPVALRTFKDQAGSCATVLRVPVEPLQPKDMSRTIRNLPAERGAKTPIAKALSKVPQDLRGVDGHRVVVLVTDGKEDCGGDPAAAIAALAEAGYTSTVHIIGYDIGDDDVRGALAEWAALGGGRYLDAPDQASLDAALAAVVTAPYLVFDGDDLLVAQGLVGDEGVELEAGWYRVEVLTDPAMDVDVELEAGEVVEVPLSSSEASAE